MNNTALKRSQAGLCTNCGLRPSLPGILDCLECSEARKLRKKAKRKKAKTAGICLKCCCRPATPGKTLCEHCRKGRSAARRKKVANGQCYFCQAPATDGFKTCMQCREEVGKHRNAETRARKDRVIAHYSSGSMACACCGVSIRQFLTLDHIAGNGNKHRKQLATSGGDPVYRWIEKHGYPDGFQVLCFNCNCGRSLNGGVCPHYSADTTDCQTAQSCLR